MIQWNAATLQAYGKCCRDCNTRLSFFRQHKGICLDCESQSRLANLYATYIVLVGAALAYGFWRILA